MIYKSLTEMPVWQKAHYLAVEVFNLTIGLPGSEDYGLTSQIRKSSNGAAACIAEGFGRSTKKDNLKSAITLSTITFKTLCKSILHNV